MPEYRFGTSDTGVSFRSGGASALTFPPLPSASPPPPPPPPGGLTMAMTVEYVDASGTLQKTPVVDNVTTISGVAPFSVVFDSSATRSEQTDADDLIGAWWNIGHLYNFGEAKGGTWPYSGRPRDTDRGFPYVAHTFDTPGTYTVSDLGRDSAGNQATMRVIVEVAARASGVAMTSGVMPTWASDTVYLAPAGGTWGNPDFSGLENITVVKTGEGADPIFGTVTLDGRNEPDEVITRANRIKFVNCDVAQVGWGNVGVDHCTFIGGRVRALSIPSMQFAGASLILNNRTALQVSNVRMPSGVFFQETGEISEASGQYIMIGECAGLHFKGVYFNKLSSGEHNVRGCYNQTTMRHFAMRNTGGASTSWFKLQGTDCTLDTTTTGGGAIRGGTPDQWPEDGTMIELATPESPTAAGGRLLGLPLWKVAIVDFVLGGDGDTVPSASAGMGPENNDTTESPPPAEQFPAQGCGLAGFEYGVVYHASITGFQFTGKGVGCRDVVLDNGAGDPVSTGTGAGTNRIPTNWNGWDDLPAGGDTPYFTSGTRPVPVPE